MPVFPLHHNACANFPMDHLRSLSDATMAAGDSLKGWRMPFVKPYTKKDGTKVKGHYRLNSIWNFFFGFLLLILFLAVVNRH
jgi:hypothetical protein